MYEHGATWTLVGDDGTTVTFNDGNGLYLEEISGFDAPNIRQNVEDLPEWDGAVAGDFWYGSRPVTLSGRIAKASAAARNEAVVNLQRALRGMRADATLKSTASGLPAMQIGARFAGLRVSGGYVKQFQIQMVCPDPRIVSQTLNDEIDATGAGGLAPGASFPLTFNIIFGGGAPAGADASVNCANAGNFDANPLIRVYGPATSVEVYNAATDESFYVDAITLVNGEYVEIDMAERTVTKSDGTNWYDRVRFPGSRWWLLEPGTSTIELYGTDFSNGITQLEVKWRDTWC